LIIALNLLLFFRIFYPSKSFIKKEIKFWRYNKRAKWIWGCGKQWTKWVDNSKAIELSTL